MLLSAAVMALASVACGGHRDPTQAPLGAVAQPSGLTHIDALYADRSGIEPRDQQPLNDAARPFARYLNAMHARLHPIFADGFLAWADRRPASDPLGDRSLRTTIELVIAPADGRVLRRGIVRTSGVTAFDISAVASVDRASPFGPAPRAIVSFDGNVHVQWDFRRDEMACSTLGAHPYLLASP